MEESKKPSNPVCYTPSSEPFRIYRLRVFENRVLRRIFGPKTNEMIESWRRLHTEELIKITMSKRMRCAEWDEEESI
jgi:hypothetical protein